MAVLDIHENHETNVLENGPIMDTNYQLATDTKYVIIYEVVESYPPRLK